MADRSSCHTQFIHRGTLNVEYNLLANTSGISREMKEIFSTVVVLDKIAEPKNVL